MLKTVLERYRQHGPIAALLMATFLWGSSFLSTGTALHYTDPFFLLAMRFGTGLLIVGAWLGKGCFHIPFHTWKAGLFSGTVLFFGYLTNALGLMTISSSMSGFLMALYVPFTPLFVWIIFGKHPDSAAFIGVAIAFIGLILLANPFTLSFSNNFGEWVTILSAFISAMEIIIVGLVAVKNDPLPLTFAQLMTVFVLSSLSRMIGPLTPWWSFEPTVFTPTLLFTAVWLGMIVGFAQMLLTWGQRYVSAGRTAVIFSMESVFAAILGWFVGEQLGWNGWLGGACIVGAILISETKLLRWERKK